MKEIEPKILPLVQALNSTGLVYTFSSCQGHFDQFHRFKDKNKAEVRFYPEDNSSKNEIEKFFCYLLSKFNDQYGFSPVILSAYKLYTSLKPNENETVDLTDWYLLSTKGEQIFNFPEGFKLNAGEEVIIAGYGLRDTGDFIFEDGSGVWNNSENDDAILYDNNRNEVSYFDDGM